MSFEAPITAWAGVTRVANSKNHGETEIYRETDIDGEAAIDVEPISTKSRYCYEDGISGEAKNRYKTPIGGKSDIIDPSILINGYILAYFSTTAEGLKGGCGLVAPNGHGLGLDASAVGLGLGASSELNSSGGLGLDAPAVGLGLGVSCGLNSSGGLGLDALAVGLGLGVSCGLNSSLANFDDT